MGNHSCASSSCNQHRFHIDAPYHNAHLNITCHTLTSLLCSYAFCYDDNRLGILGYGCMASDWHWQDWQRNDPQSWCIWHTECLLGMIIIIITIYPIPYHIPWTHCLLSVIIVSIWCVLYHIFSMWYGLVISAIETMAWYASIHHHHTCVYLSLS